MSKVIDLINYWKESGKDFEMGVGIFCDYGRSNQHIRSFLLKAKARGGNIPPKARLRLESEMQMIYAKFIGTYLASSEKSQERELIKEAAKEVVKSRKLADDEIALMGKISNPYASISNAELLIYDRKRIGAQRALLSNDLRKDGGDKDIIEENISILNKMKPLIDQMKFIEKRLKDIEGGKEQTKKDKAEKNENENAIIIRIGVGKFFSQYSYGDLTAMSLAEVKALRKRIRDAKSKSYQKSRPGTTKVKNEATRLRHEKEHAIKVKELELINIIISHKEKKSI